MNAFFGYLLAALDVFLGALKWIDHCIDRATKPIAHALFLNRPPGYMRWLTVILCLIVVFAVAWFITNPWSLLFIFLA